MKVIAIIARYGINHVNCVSKFGVFLVLVSNFYKISEWFFEYKFYALQNVFITLSGAWKLGGFGFAIPASQNHGELSNQQAFHYAVSGNI